MTAQDIPAPMKPFRLVNDFAGVFTTAETGALESKLRSYNDTTSTQIYVVTVDDLGGYAVSDYTFALGDKWGVGQSGKDNGVVILIKPKIGNSRGQVYIATGYGIEAHITDAAAGRISRDVMLPYFRHDNYYQGVDAAVDAIVAYLAGEYEADKSENSGVPVWVIVLIFLAIFILINSGSKGDHNATGGGRHRSGGRPVIFPPSRGGSFGGGSMGGGRGFGGGGGGRFGGGGGGASW